MKNLTQEEVYSIEILERISRALEEHDKSIKPIAVFSSGDKIAMSLYENRIEDIDNQLIMLDDKKMEITCTDEGDISYTTDISGGETYTGSISGTIVGGLIAGSVGAAMGALTPHSAGVKTKHIKHDDRTRVIRIKTEDSFMGYFEKLTLDNGKDNPNLQLADFYRAILSAKSTYKRNKKAIDSKYKDIMEIKSLIHAVQNDYGYEDKVEKVEKKYGISLKTGEILDSNAKMANILHGMYADKDKQIKSGLRWAIISLLISWYPLCGWICGPVALYKIRESRKRTGALNESLNRKANIAKIVAWISIIIGSTVPFIIFGKN